MVQKLPACFFGSDKGEDLIQLLAMAGENSGDHVTEPETVQIQKLEAALASERKRCADKDKQLQMMEALLGRLQSRLEVLEDNLKEQQRKNRAGSGTTVLDLQQQLADELAKRKQAQYSLIEKGQELCDVQEKLAESQQRIKELLVAKAAEKAEVKKSEGKSRCDDHGTPQLIISAASHSPCAKSPMGHSPCASRVGSYAPPIISPCATPQSPGDFKQFFPLPPKMMVPPLSLPISGDKSSEWQHRTVRAAEPPHISYSLEIPEMSEVQPMFLECPLPNTCHSGYHTPVHHYQQVQVDYPRILSAKLAQAQDKMKPSVKSARVVSAEHRSACVPPRALQSMPLARPVCGESPRFST